MFTSDQTTRQNAFRETLLAIAVATVATPLLLALALYSYNSADPRPVVYSDEFPSLPAHEKINEALAVCASVPKPEEFHLTERETAVVEADSATIVEHYETKRPKEEIMGFLGSMLTANYSYDRENDRFKNWNSSVSIVHDPVPGTNNIFRYVIICRRFKSEVSFGIYDI